MPLVHLAPDSVIAATILRVSTSSGSLLDAALATGETPNIQTTGIPSFSFPAGVQFLFATSWPPGSTFNSIHFHMQAWCPSGSSPQMEFFPTLQGIVLPQTLVGEFPFSYDVDITNPTDLSDIYATAIFNGGIAAGPSWGDQALSTPSPQLGFANDVRLDLDYSPPVPATDLIEVWLGPWAPPGCGPPAITRFRPFKLIATTDPNPQIVSADYVHRFGQPPAGSVIWSYSRTFTSDESPGVFSPLQPFTVPPL